MNKSTFSTFFLTAIFLIGATGCSTSSNNDKIDTSISGVVQKGPFVTGTQITLTDMNASLQQTGNVFTTVINNDRGSFNIDDISLSSSTVELSADGFYFNEITGDISSAQLTLYALADIENKTSVNVNLLTHLEKGRVEYLMDEEELDFREAKRTAQNEILQIFDIENSNLQDSEAFVITASGEGNAILLAVSVILQSNRSVGQMSELIADLSNEIRGNGSAIDNAFIEELKRDAINVNLNKVRANLENRYTELGANISIPTYEEHVSNFVTELYLEIVETDNEGTILKDYEGQWSPRMSFENFNHRNNDGPVSLPPNYSVYPASPNPFIDSTTISYQMPQSSKVLVTLKAQETGKTDTLVAARQPAGNQTIVLTDIEPGYYKVDFDFGLEGTNAIYGFIHKEE